MMYNKRRVGECLLSRTEAFLWSFSSLTHGHPVSVGVTVRFSCDSLLAKAGRGRSYNLAPLIFLFENRADTRGISWVMELLPRGTGAITLPHKMMSEVARMGVLKNKMPIKLPSLKHSLPYMGV